MHLSAKLSYKVYVSFVLFTSDGVEVVSKQYTIWILSGTQP